jgi:hypothetical protein
MKAIRILSMLGLFAVLVTYANCDGSKPTPEPITDVQLGKLSKTWKINSVTLDGVDKKADYTTFQLALTGTKGNTSFGYSASGRPARSPWKSTGSWEFGTAPETQIVRDKGSADELAMTYAVTESTLEITFTFTGDGYNARTGVVKGAWKFNFIP